MARTSEQIYKVHSGVRKRHTKMKRRKSPGRHRLVQRLAGGAIIVRRVRPANITESQIRQHLAELQRAYDEGRAEVRTVGGQLVDLKTMKVLESPVSPPKPHPPLDSAALDKEHVGELQPVYPGGKAQTEEVDPLPSPALPGDDSVGEPVKSGGDPAVVRKQSRKGKSSGKSSKKGK